MYTYLQGTHLDAPPFGNTKIRGLQLKGFASTDIQDVFVKLDTLNPEVKGDWENSYDVQFSSVTEAIVSTLTQNIKNSPIRNVNYNFYSFELNNGTHVTGTCSDIYTLENEIELTLSSGNGSKTNTLITVEDYESDIFNQNTDNRLSKLAQALPIDNAEEFFIQQAGFDILTGNTDRIDNPSNFVAVKNVETGKITGVNMDYGRCLQLPIRWTSTTEENYLVDEFGEEDIQQWSETMYKTNSSILSGLPYEQQLAFLEEHNFQPFEVDIDAVNNDLESLKESVKGTPCEKFATIKIDIFKEILHKYENKLWLDSSKILTNEDFDRLDNIYEKC